MAYCKKYEKMQKKYNRYRMLGMGDRLGKILKFPLWITLAFITSHSIFDFHSWYDNKLSSREFLISSLKGNL